MILKGIFNFQKNCDSSDTRKSPLLVRDKIMSFIPVSLCFLVSKDLESIFSFIKAITKLI